MSTTSRSRSVKRKFEFHDENEIVVDDDFGTDEDVLLGEATEEVDSDEEV